MASKSESLQRGTKQEKEERQAFAATPSDGVEGQNPATRKREKAKAEKVDEDVREAWKMKREGASDDDILNYFIQEGKSVAKTVKILAALSEPAPAENATSEEPAPSHIPDTGQSWIQPASVGMQQVQKQQQQQAQAGDPGETPQATPEPAATPTAPGNGPTKAEKEQAEKLVRSAAFRALKYREMRIKDDDITQNLQEGGMTPELISQTFALMNSIERGRIYKAKDRARVEKEQQRQERREIRNLGASLGQVETKRGSTWEEPKEAAPIGRERAPSVPVSNEPLVQVETRPAQEAKPVETDSTDPTLLLTHEKRERAPKRVKSPPESHPTIALGYEPSEGTPLDALMSSVEPEPVSEPILRIGYTERAPRAKRVREANEIMPTIHLGYERDDKVEETKEIKPKLSKGTIPPSVSRVVKSMDTTRSYASKKAAAAEAAAAASIAAIIRNKEAGERVPTTSSVISDTLPEQFERTPTHKAATAYIDSLSNPQSSSDGRGADTPVLETKTVSGKDEVHPAPVASDSDSFTLSADEQAAWDAAPDMPPEPDVMEKDAAIEMSEVFNPFRLRPDIQTEFDALKSDIHAAERQRKVDEALEAFRNSSSMESMPTVEGTRKEWENKLRSLIESAKERVGGMTEGMSGRFDTAKEYLGSRASMLTEGIASKYTKSSEVLATGKEKAAKLKAYLADRNTGLSEKAKMLGKGAGENIMKTSEWYRKLPLKYKIGLSAALIGTTVLTGGGSTFVTVLTSSAMLGQRALGSLGVYTLVEGSLEKAMATTEQKLLLSRKRIDSVLKHGIAVTAGLIVFTGVPGLILKEGFDAAGGENLIKWLGNALGFQATMPNEGVRASAPGSPTSASGGAAPAAAPAASPAVTVPAGSPPSTGAEGGGGTAAPAPVAQPEAPAQTQPAAAAAAGTEVAPSATVMEASKIEVKATPGKGYEYMTKRLWEQLQEKNIKLPSGANPDSDLAKLLAADKNSIDKVVHQLATENEFFKKTGESVRIGLDSRMSIDANGDITLDGNPVAPQDAPVTPAYHPEVKAGIQFGTEPIRMTETTVSTPADVPLAHPDAPMASSGTEVPVASVELPPVVNHDFVINAHEVTIPLAEPHIYTDDKNLMIYGGSAAEQSKKMLEYLSKNPTQTVLSGDDAGKYRIPWRVVEGKLVPDDPVETEGFLGFLKAFVPPPSPEEFKEVVD